MPAAVYISEPIVREYIGRAVRDVFTTMIDCRPALPPPVARAGEPAAVVMHQDDPQVVGTVGFVGECSGLIYLHFPLPFARLCTGRLLGLSDAELAAVGDEAINDAIGELTNMTVGAFKTGLCDAGHPCTLTIPSILRGSNFTVEMISSAVRHVYHFECSGHRVTADILMRSED